jgi:hypothetical protein
MAGGRAAKTRAAAWGRAVRTGLAGGPTASWGSPGLLEAQGSRAEGFGCCEEHTSFADEHVDGGYVARDARIEESIVPHALVPNRRVGPKVEEHGKYLTHHLACSSRGWNTGR